jgi:DNA polymerase III delta prime subunit
MNLFKDVIGQKKITENLSRAVTGNKLHHAYLFSGQAGVGKEAVALELIKIVNCQTGKVKDGYCGECRPCRDLSSFSSDDLLYIFPTINKAGDTDKVLKEKADMIRSGLKEKLKYKGYYKFSFKSGRFITLGQIDEIKHFARYNSINRSKKFVVIYPAETMNKEAQNSLLKILEEPPTDLFFILISETPSFVLDTIRSRCMNIPFPALSGTDVEEYIKRYHPNVEEELFPDLVADSFGSIDTLTKLLTDSGAKLVELHKNLYTIFYDSLPPKTIKMIDSFIDDIKELSDTEIDFVLRKTLNALLNSTFGDERKESLSIKTVIISDFERFGIMYRRNISPRLLMINLYLNFREEFKKWKTR